MCGCDSELGEEILSMQETVRLRGSHRLARVFYASKLRREKDLWPKRL